MQGGMKLKKKSLNVVH